MKPALALLALATALTTSLVGALSAQPIPVPAVVAGRASVTPAVATGTEARLILVDDDGDDDDGWQWLSLTRRGHDDDDDDEGCGDDDGGNGGCARGNNPAPAGQAAPPANGLFGTGAGPKVQMN